MKIDITTLTIAEAAQAIREKDFTAEALVEAYFAHATERNQETNAFVELFEDAVAEAKKIDARIAAGEKMGPLAGVPIAIKDNILIKDKVATSASKILEGYKASYDATVIEKLRRAGAILLGRANMDEFAMGASTESSFYGPTKNPRALSRVPGGSSGGSAAAVADNAALGALGSDTGGSIRQPGSFCGVVGMKPTYGAVSRYGVMAMASSLDQIGPLAKTVEDAEIIYDVIKGYDPMDSTSIPEKTRTELETDSRDAYTIGVPSKFVYQDGVDPAVVENFKEMVKKLEGAGHKIKEIDLPNAGYSLAAYYIIMPAEASTNLARYDGMRYGLHEEGDTLLEEYEKTRGVGFGKEVRRRIILGTYVLSSGYYDAYYNKAIGVRNLITQDFKKAFKDVDAVMMPTSPTPAFKIGEKTNDPLQMYLADIFTVSANLAGIPGISVPSGTVAEDGDDLPLGIQFLAPIMHESTLFALGREVEKLR